MRTSSVIISFSNTHTCYVLSQLKSRVPLLSLRSLSEPLLMLLMDDDSTYVQKEESHIRDKVTI